MDTETIDRLYLELSQVTNAKTGKELLYEETLKQIRALPLDTHDHGIKVVRMADEALRRAQLR